MKNFLKNLLQIRKSSAEYETDKYLYTVDFIFVYIDLFIIDFSFGFAYWFTRESFEERMKVYDEYIAKLFAEFELTEAAAPAKTKKPAKKAAKKKKPASKK